MDDLEKNKFPYPRCWSDDVRMDVLMAPFRVKSVNPENYDSKMIFWQKMIAKYCEYKGSPSFNKKELQLAFQRKDQLPYGLDIVLTEMRNTGKTRLKTEYMYDPENSWTTWTVNNFVKKPLWWSVKKVWPGNEDESNNEIMHLDLIKKFCKDLYIVLQKHSGNLIHYDDVKDIIQNAINLNDDGIHICLHTLHCEKKVFVEYTIENGEKKICLVKIPGKTDQNVEITEKDRALHNLQMTQKDLTNQLHLLENDIKAIDEKLRSLLKENKRQLAKTYLRKKHMLENNHGKRSIALNNVETLICSFDEAQSNSILLEAYKIGSKALQKVLNDFGLKLSNVDDIMSDVRETVENSNEIQEAVANANFADKFDEDDLERELREILEEPNISPVEPIGNNNNMQVEINDAELIAMLNNLEVEKSDPSKADGNANQTTASREL